MTAAPWLRNLLSGTVKILGLVVIAAASIALLVLYLVGLNWAIGRYGSAGPDETTWEDYGAVLYLWIPPAVLGGSVGGYLWWVLNEWRYFRTWNRGRGQQLLFFVLGGAGAAVLVNVFFLGFGGAGFSRSEQAHGAVVSAGHRLRSSHGRLQLGRPSGRCGGSRRGPQRRATTRSS